MTALVERLRAYTEAVRLSSGEHVYETPDITKEAADRIEALEAALKPFAAKVDWPLGGIDPEYPVLCQAIKPSYETGGHSLASFGLSVGDFRAARTALSEPNHE